MNDSQFDDFVNDKLNEYAAPVPAGLWEKVAEGQFDQFIGGKLQNHIAPVPEGLYEKIADAQFDQFIGNSLKDHTAAVPQGLFEKITDGQFDSFIADKLQPAEAPVPGGLWDKVADGQFDSFVSGKLRDAEAPVPAGLWEKVKPEDDEDDRVAFWWFRYPAAAVLILALLTAGAVGSYFFFSGKKQNADPTLVQSANKSTSEPSPDRPGNNNTVAVPPVVNPGQSSVENNVHPVVPSNRSAAESTSRVNNDLDQPGQNNDTKGNTENTAGHSITIPNSPTGLRFAPPVNKAGDFSANPNEVLANIQSSITKNEGTAVAGNENKYDLVIEPYQPGYTEASTISRAKFSLADLSNKQLFAGNHKFKSVIICPSDKGINTDWYLETYLSPDIAFKSVSNVSASPTYMLKKDSAERSRIGYTAGIRLVNPITDNILLKAGLQYSQGNEQYVYRTENEVKTTTVVTVRTIIRAPGDTVIVNDTSILQTAGFKTNTVKNRYRSFDIPVTVGYQFGDEDLKIGINAGVVFNITSWYQGMVLDSTLANVPLNKNGNGIYRSNIGLGLTGSVSIVKRLSDDLHLFAEPYFRYNLSDMSTAQSGFKQRVSIGGLQLGLRFNLNRK